MYEEPTVQYHCPGEEAPIPRAVHLGRLARFYPACRRCMHRDDTAGLSPRQVKRLAETQRRGQPREPFYAEGVAGVYLNDLGPETAQRIAAAFGVYLQREDPQAAEPPSVAIGGDGRPLTTEIVAAVGEGLRWSGCQVIDLGRASAGSLALVLDHLHAAGGILIGNPSDEVQVVGLKLWAHQAQPLSAPGGLEAVRHVFQSGIDRPTRRSGPLRRFQADLPYLASLGEHYHALRPLRLVLDTNCRPVATHLEKLTQSVACQILPCRTGRERLSEQIRADRAHFGVRIDDDGERLSLWDERGRSVAHEQVLVLIAQHLAREEPKAVVVEQGTAPEWIGLIESFGSRVVLSDPRRSEMVQAMHAHQAALGGGPSGRLWYGKRTDALLTLTHLLVRLSQGDQPLSEVLGTCFKTG